MTRVGRKDTKRADAFDAVPAQPKMGMTKHGGYIKFKKQLKLKLTLYVSRRLNAHLRLLRLFLLSFRSCF